MNWPPSWEETFADRDNEERYQRRIVNEVRLLKSAQPLSPEQKDTICWVLLTVDEWASALSRDLRACAWTHAELRGPIPRFETDRDRKKWQRFRWLLDAHDACWATRETIVAGDWIDAISWAMQAGNRLLRDKAATGRVRGAALSNPESRTTRANRLADRNALILRQANEMRRRNPVLKDSDIANRLADKTFDQITLPGAETIRKILRAARKSGNI